MVADSVTAGAKAGMVIGGTGLSSTVLEGNTSATVKAAVMRLASAMIGPAMSASRVDTTDPWEQSYGQEVLPPPIPKEVLAVAPSASNILAQAIDAISTNISSHGYEFEVIVKDEDELTKYEKEIAEEKDTLEWVFDYFHRKDSFETIESKIRVDMETIGEGYLEVRRNLKGQPCSGSHALSVEMRIARLETQPQKVKLKKLNKTTWQYDEIDEWVTFRRYVKIRGMDKVWFKEFGDLRIMDYRTGQYNDNTPAEFRATELIHFPRYASGTPYGKPRYEGNIYSILGSRKAEQANYDYFMNNMIPAMVVLCSGGIVAELEQQKLEQDFQGVRGADGLNKILVIQALPPESASATEKPGPVRLDMKPLTQFQQKDALYQIYDKNNILKLLSAMRTPPILVGMTADYNKATSEAAMEMFEKQLCGPERKRFDFIINRTIMTDLGVRFHKFVSKGPDLMNYLELAQIHDIIAQHGGSTPNLMRKFYNLVFKDNAPMIEESWGNEPYRTAPTNPFGAVNGGEGNEAEQDDVPPDGKKQPPTDDEMDEVVAEKVAKGMEALVYRAMLKFHDTVSRAQLEEE